MNIDTRTVDPTKLLAELNKRPELWLNVLQSMSEMTADELNDAPTDHASFETMLAVSFAEHTSTFDNDGNEVTSIDIYQPDDRLYPVD